MTDTEILNEVVGHLRWHIDYSRPISPLLAGDMLKLIDALRNERRRDGSQ